VILDAKDYHWQDLNEKIQATDGDITIENSFGERFIGCGKKQGTITIHGVAGNALGAYLDGGTIITSQNVQDAVGDTMNDGKIIVYGNAGDALGYAMRGGTILVKGDSGYRTGIHMKQYLTKRPVIVVGGKTGSFLGEYLAGGLIIVLGLGIENVPSGEFIGTGMHGGEIWIRSKKEPKNLPAQVLIQKITTDGCEEIMPYINEYAEKFKISAEEIMKGDFYKLTPNAKSPYKQLYTQN